MSRPDPEGPRSELDALLSSRTPDPEAEIWLDSTLPDARADGPRGEGAVMYPPGRLGPVDLAPGQPGAASDGVRPGVVGEGPMTGRLDAWLRRSGSDAEEGQLASGGLGELRDVPIGSIRPNAYQPRQHFDESAIGALADSIRELGVLQPVLLRPDGDGRYELVAGERRWRAAQEAGLRTIPALVRQAADQASLEQAIVENLHRQDLNPLEEAAAYQQLAEDFGLTQEDVARRVGKSRSAITNTVRLLQLSAPVQRLVGEGRLSAGHARALLAVADRDAQSTLADRVVADELSVRQTEELVRRWDGADGGAGDGAVGSGAGSRDSARRDRSAAAFEVEGLLGDHLDTQVEVRWKGGGGQLLIRFADGEDLDRIVRSFLAGDPRSFDAEPDASSD